MMNDQNWHIEVRNDWVIFDLDGTLADHNHRLEHAEKHDWDRYFELARYDKVNSAEVVVLRMFQSYQVKICILTGRPEKYKSETVAWLKEHHISYDELSMRKSGDRRPSWEIKQEYVLDCGDHIICALDDRPSVVNMFRDLGITCFQTQPGVDIIHNGKGENVT